MRKLAWVVCSIEYLLAVLLVLGFAPLRHGEAIIPGNASLATLVDFGGFVILGVGFLLYCIGATIAIFGRTAQFWNSAMPLIAGLPILVWGFGRLQLAAGLPAAAVALILCSILMLLLIYKSSFLRWSPLPLVLLGASVLTFYWRESWIVYVPVGSLLIAAPLYLIIRKYRRGAGARGRECDL